MIMGFENINECNEFLHNLNIHYKNGKIEKESCEYLRDLERRKLGFIFGKYYFWGHCIRKNV